jgi:Reverse transcriptase (RNA-dependent DNA polymerase)
VVKKYIQTCGIDYHEIFAPVAKNEHRHNFIVHYGKFWVEPLLNGCKKYFSLRDTRKEVYINLSPDHRKVNISNLVCRLKKSIYRLKQSTRVWYDKLSIYFF